MFSRTHSDDRSNTGQGFLTKPLFGRTRIFFVRIKVMRNLLFVLTIAVLGACAPKQTFNELINPDPVVPELNLIDGVDSSEASIIASNYYVLFIKGYEVMGDPIELDQQWQVPLVRGTSRKMVGNITIDKETGQVSSTSGPTITDPSALRGTPRSS